MATGLFTLKQQNQALRQGAWSGYIAPRWVEYLVVAGGGGAGGNYGGGGGGAGGLLTGIVTVTSGASYTVTVGGGGAASAGSGSGTGVNGVASVFGSISSVGGGGGSDGQGGIAANSGGSGGGTGGEYANGGLLGAQGTSGQGNSGGKGSGGNGGSGYSAGGGGGAGTVGLNAVTTTVAGNGGAGIASAITGTVVAYSGGGGGGAGYLATASAGVGGVGGGGTAGTSGNGTAASANTGGGGGGGGFNVSSLGAAGGSGIVVVRYPGNVQFYTGGTVTYSNGYIVHNFTANGTLAPTTPTVVSEYQISRSLRFNSADSAYLTRTPANAGNRKTYTISVWCKRASTEGTGTILNARTGAPWAVLAFSTGDGVGTNPSLQFSVSAGSSSGVYTNAVFRDVSAWYHIICAVDTTQATASNRVKIYINSVLQDLTSGNYPTLNQDTQINSTIAHEIGNPSGYSNASNFYLTEYNFIDGQALPPTSFGYVNPTTGIWSPAKFVGGYGTNGFYLNFSDNSNTTAATLGKDYSGNGNNWTPNNFSVTAGVGNDSLVDVPTPYGTDTGAGGQVRGNYCTLNPLDFANGTISNGSLDWSATSGTGLGCFSTFAFDIADSTNQYYWEFTLNSGDLVFGIVPTTTLPSNTSRTGSYSYYTNGNKYSGTTATAYGASFTTGAVIGVSVGSGTITFYKNGVSQGAAFTGLTGIFKPAIWEVVCTATANFGQRPFAYTAPSGFKALCTQNLPTPTIGATTATQAGKFFNPVLYTGTGATRTVTGVGFAPDWVWIKSRSAAYNNRLYDKLRGVENVLQSNSTAAEGSDGGGLTVFGSDGFTLGSSVSQNESASTFVSWNWKANGAGSFNSAGSITSTVSANTTSGFSIVTYTGTGANATVGHGLGAVPSMIIVKCRNAAGDIWDVYHVSIGNTQYLRLNGPNPAATYNSWQNTTPTSTVFYISTDTVVNTNGNTYVAYCFAPIAGYSAFGSYVGNGSTDGPFIYTGFRPAFILTKDVTTSSYWWEMVDSARSPYNTSNVTLYANVADAEYTSSGYHKDLLSNGFKVKGTSGAQNTSGSTYIYMAFASNPFKYSLAR